MTMFGNVNVDYKPCKSSFQVKQAADYMLGRLPEQVRDGVIKTAPNLYWSFNADRDNFARDVVMTRKLFGKKDSRNANLAYKMSISFSPEDSERLSYEEALKIAAEFAQQFFKGYEVLFAVHTDKPHIHVHFLIGNCHIDTGHAFRRNQRDLYDMCEYFGQQCEKRGLMYSIRDSYFKADSNTDRETFAERQMKAKGKETFKDELREVIRIEVADPNNHTLDDVVAALMRHYNVECRVRGNTISYRHPNFTDKSGKLVSVRGSKLGDQYTVRGIINELTKKRRERAAEVRTEAQTGILHARDAAERCSKAAPEGKLFTSNRDTGDANGNNKDAGHSGAGRDRSQSNRADTGITGRIGTGLGALEGKRAGDAHDDIRDQHVPTLEELFRSYDRRNGKKCRKPDAEPEHPETVRRKRKGIDR